MKKMLLITLVVSLLIGTMAAGVLAYGNGQGMNGPGPGQGPRHGQIFKDLNLTTEQQQKILEIRQAFQKDTIDLRFEMQKKHLELRQLWATKPLNQAAIDTKTKELNALRIQMMNKAQVMHDKIKAVLTPEQQKKLDDAGFKPGMKMGRRGGCDAMF